MRRRAYWKIEDFLAKNPTEELTAADAAAKFGIAQGYAARLLAQMSGDKVVERLSVYRLRRPQ